MRKEDLQDILKRVPLNDQTSIVLTLQSGLFLSVDTVVRYEAEYLVIRGREGGTTDEGRAFFVPFKDISFVKLDRVVKAAELKRMYGETVALDFEESMAAEKVAGDAAAAASAKAPTKIETADPATIAKQNLLARIRAARTSGGGSPGSPGT
jgi:hypothetical protein